MAENEFENTPETVETTPSPLDAKPIQVGPSVTPQAEPQPAEKPKPRRTRRKNSTKE